MSEQHDMSHEIEQLPSETTHRVSENEETVRNAIRRHKSNTLGALLNWREGQTLRMALIDEIHQGLTYRKQALQMALDTRLQSMEEACNHVLLTSKAQLRQQRSLFFAQKFAELTNEMDKLTDEFIAGIDRQLSSLSELRHEQLREHKRQRLVYSFEQFFNTLKKLEDGFSHIIEEGVTRQ